MKNQYRIVSLTSEQQELFDRFIQEHQIEAVSKMEHMQEYYEKNLVPQIRVVENERLASLLLFEWLHPMQEEIPAELEIIFHGTTNKQQEMRDLYEITLSDKVLERKLNKFYNTYDLFALYTHSSLRNVDLIGEYPGELFYNEEGRQLKKIKIRVRPLEMVRVF